MLYFIIVINYWLYFPCMGVQSLSRVQRFGTHRLHPATLLGPWNFPGKNTGVGYHFLLQGIFPTQGVNPCPCISGTGSWILYHCTTCLIYRCSLFYTSTSYSTTLMLPLTPSLSTLVTTANHQFPKPGLNPCPLQWKHGVLTDEQVGKSLVSSLLIRMCECLRNPSAMAGGHELDFI